MNEIKTQSLISGAYKQKKGTQKVWVWCEESWHTHTHTLIDDLGWTSVFVGVVCRGRCWKSANRCTQSNVGKPMYPLWNEKLDKRLEIVAHIWIQRWERCGIWACGGFGKSMNEWNLSRFIKSVTKGKPAKSKQIHTILHWKSFNWKPPNRRNRRNNTHRK